ncbi:TolR-like protein [Minicystis rosea]|nr:TolR-like protein [Minicystis rosea]
MPEAEVLSPAQRSKIRRLSVVAAPEPGEESGELNIVPYLDIIMNIMMFVLATVAVTFTSSIPTSAASIGPRPGPTPPEALNLTALITSQGVALKTASGAIAAGCGDFGAGITVPNVSGDYDLTGLTACVRRLKGSHSAYAGETQVAVTASPDVPYASVVSVMDALRADASGVLFPDVRLGVAR